MIFNTDNLNTDSVFFLFLFILPGAFSKILKKRFAPTHISIDRNKSALMETSEIVVVSSVIYLINKRVIDLYRKNIDAQEAVELFGSISKADFLTKYVLLTLAVTILFTIIFHYFNKKVLTWFVNRWNVFNGHSPESEYQTIWENVFESKNYFDFDGKDKNGVIMSITKDGTVLSSGYIREIPAPCTECDDIVLEKNKAVDDFLSQNPAPITRFEYTVLSQGVTLKVYNYEDFAKYIKARPKK